MRRVAVLLSLLVVLVGTPPAGGQEADNTPPAIEILDPPEGADLPGDDADFDVTASDAGSGVARVTIDGVEVTAGQDGHYRRRVNVGRRDSITIEAFDRAGNKAVKVRRLAQPGGDGQPPSTAGPSATGSGGGGGGGADIPFFDYGPKKPGTLTVRVLTMVRGARPPFRSMPAKGFKAVFGGGTVKLSSGSIRSCRRQCTGKGYVGYTASNRLRFTVKADPGYVFLGFGSVCGGRKTCAIYTNAYFWKTGGFMEAWFKKR